MSKQLILASASPRRKELLDQLAVSYWVHAVDIDETPLLSEGPVDYVRRVAAEKSVACVLEANFSLPVLSADTSVVINGEILGKPENKEHAFEMFNKLSGNAHTVYSAVSLRAGDKHWEALSKTAVKFRTFSVAEMEAYWWTEEPLGKAGGYAIQGRASIFVESIQGSYSGVVGLPLFETAGLLSKIGINVIT